MALQDVIAHIDAEIDMLQKAKALLSGTAAPATTTAPAVKKSGRGRPKGSKNAAKPVEETPAVKGKRKLSPEGRKAIAEAMKKRWAERRKLAAK